MLLHKSVYIIELIVLANSVQENRQPVLHQKPPAYSD